MSNIFGGLKLILYIAVTKNNIMKTYTTKTVQNLINNYVNKLGGQVTTIEEGSLGFGLTILHNANKYKNIVITEVYESGWSSTHKIRQYNKLPKKYQKMLDNIL